jgi:hypothetical protein
MISIISNNLNKIDFELLSYNINAIELLKDNQDKINWEVFSRNSKIFIN